MKEIQCEQGSSRWHHLRGGKITASAVGDIVTPTGAPTDSDKRTGRLYRLAAEIAAGRPYNHEYDYQNKAMVNGVVREPEAADRFANDYKVRLRECGFHVTDDERMGASLDRMIIGSHDKEAVEIKCPLSGTHAEYLCTEEKQFHKAIKNYKQQMQLQMYVADLQAVHFYSYHPDFPAKHVLTLRDQDFINKMLPILAKFIVDLDKAVEIIQDRGFKNVWPAATANELGLTG